jgi:hypothetical protein
MPFEAYIGYLTDEKKEIKKEVGAGKPIVVEVRDLDTFERKVVRALVATPPGKLEDGDELWVLDWVESRQPEPWSIRVLEELDEEAATAARSDIGEKDLRAAAEESQKYAGRKYRGASMPEMMGQEETRKYYENIAGTGGKKK